MTNENQPIERNEKFDRVVYAIVSEILRVMTLKNKVWARKLIGNLLKKPIRKMAEIVVSFDEEIAVRGWSATMKDYLDDFVTDYRVKGFENVPQTGPLLIACNHPGSYDMPIISTVMGRDDVKFIASDISIVHELPNIMEHFIFMSRDAHHSMLTVRTAIRHLQAGGAVLIYPRGDVEPDQDVTPGGRPDFERWSPSSEVLLRKVPQTRTLMVFTKGVLAPRWIKSPWIRIWKKPAQRQKIAEIFQVSHQLTGKKGFSLTPSVFFSRLLTIDDLGSVDAPSGDLLKAMIREMRALIDAPLEDQIERTV
jgi:hypothetical protein